MGWGVRGVRSGEKRNVGIVGVAAGPFLGYSYSGIYKENLHNFFWRKKKKV